MPYKNPADRTKAKRLDRIANPEKHRRWNQTSKWKRCGIVEHVQYEQRLSNQQGVCAICLQTPTKKRLAVDHDHDTGRIRGLLCCSCNLGLGSFRDDPTLLLNALSYLDEDHHA